MMAHALLMITCAILIAALPCAAAADNVPLPTKRPERVGTTPAPRGDAATASPRSHQPYDKDDTSKSSACQAPLITFTPAEQPKADAPNGKGEACRIASPGKLSSIQSGEAARKIILPGAPLLDCAYAKAFGNFVRDIADPMAIGYFAAPIAKIHTGPGFQCRYRNRAKGGKVSAHGKGIALDVASIELTNGITINVGADKARERRFIDALRKAGCGHFTTILGPGSDGAHETHVHFDTEKHGRSDNYRICQ